MPLPRVTFCGLEMSRLVIGANPFGGYSHQSPDRDRAMREYYTHERILQTWARARAAGINTMVANNETPHVLEAVKAYLAGGGSLQWIAQVNCLHKPMAEAVDEAVAIGCCAMFFHGRLVEQAYREGAVDRLRSWCEYVRAAGVPVGLAAHAPRAHLWAFEHDLADFHAVALFNCGSIHDGQGERFHLADLPAATECVQRISKPCLAYKIMGAGRIEARMAFEYAFGHIKAGDVVNVGMHRGDQDDMVEQNVAHVTEILAGMK